MPYANSTIETRKTPIANVLTADQMAALEAIAAPGQPVEVHVRAAVAAYLATDAIAARVAAAQG